MKNKNNIRLIYEVALWEFRRWFKLKEQIITLLVGAFLSVVFSGGQYLLNRTDDKGAEIAVINNSGLVIKLDSTENCKFRYIQSNELDSAKTEMRLGIIDGILKINNLDSSELLVNKEPVWLNEVKEKLSLERQGVKLKEASISEEMLRDIFTQTEITLSYIEAQKDKAGTGEKIAAGLFIGLMLMGIFIGLAYQFIAITGEKQLRITEVIVSAIKPQCWIDGKIIGISLLSLVLLFTYVITSFIFVAVSNLFGAAWNIPISISNPLLIGALLFISIAGFFFWNTFFAAIAATINDPNTSARGSLMMLPAVPAAIAFFALGNPDSTILRVLSFFPPTAAPVLSARMVLTDVGIIEILLSVGLLILATKYMRNAAGKIFAVSILMHGKEPSWKEITKWVRKSGRN